VDVQYALRKPLHEPGRAGAVSGEANEIDMMVAKRGYDFAIVIFSGLSFRRNCQGRKSQAARGIEAARVGLVRDYDDDLRAGNLARGDIRCNGFEV
jgi:hypothetical protein